MKITPRQYAVSLFEALDELKEEEIANILKSFVRILAKNNNLELAPQIIKEFVDYYNQKNGLEEVKVSTSNKLPYFLGNDLEKILEKKVEIKETVDPSLLGGIKLEFSDRVVDGSIKKRLEKLKGDLLKD